jgi:hypothetical protein
MLYNVLLSNIVWDSRRKNLPEEIEHTLFIEEDDDVESTAEEMMFEWIADHIGFCIKSCDWSVTPA